MNKKSDARRFDALDKAVTASFRRVDKKRKANAEANNGAHEYNGDDPRRQRLIERQQGTHEAVRVDSAEFTPEELEHPSRDVLRDKVKCARWIRARLTAYQQELEEKQIPSWKYPELLKKLEAELWDQAEEAGLRMDAGGNDQVSARDRMKSRQYGATDRFHEREKAKEAIRDPYEKRTEIQRAQFRERDEQARYNAKVKARQRQRERDWDEEERQHGDLGRETRSLNAEAKKLSQGGW